MTPDEFAHVGEFVRWALTAMGAAISTLALWLARTYERRIAYLEGAHRSCQEQLATLEKRLLGA